MKCSYCGAENPAGEDFCVDCGASLHPSTLDSSASAGTGSMPPLQNDSTSTTAGLNSISRVLAPNMQLENGRYVVEKILGEGGMGAAVLAYDTRVSNKRVVIKELASENLDPQQRQEDVRNFEREVETLAHLDHPLIPTVTDSFQEGSRYYMVQEYVAGENLESHMERLKRPMPEREVLTYASQVLDILVYLAQQQPPIVHRDIKPANIIIGAKDKRAHLVDFGIARADVTRNVKRKQTSALGTPGYAPPEQYQGNADARSDLYALAATMHHLLTNRDPSEYAPFTYPPVRSLVPSISSETERVLERALTLDITRRYQKATSMKDDVDEILLRLSAAPGDSYTLSPGLAATRPRPNAPAERDPAFIPRERRPSYPDGSRPEDVYAARPERGYRPQERIPEWQEPRGYRQQQQQQMFAPMPRQQPRQSDPNSYLLPSFILLMIVVLVIAAILFLLPLFAQAPLPMSGPIHVHGMGGFHHNGFLPGWPMHHSHGYDWHR